MTAVEFIVDELNKEMGLISFVTGTEESYKSAIFSIIERAKEIEKEQKIEFACKVVEVSAEKYIQGKTTEQIAEELIKQQ